MWGFLLRILTAVILTGISAYLSYRKPDQPNPGTLDDLGNPRADEGTEVIKVFGTVNIADPQVVWFGDFTTTEITEKAGRKYGLFGPKQRINIGFQYYLGIHFVVCLGPVDEISRIRIDKRSAFDGVSTGGSIIVNSPTLFGSAKREGGVAGRIDVLMGQDDQAVNQYLASRTPGPTPAYRGVTSLVARQFYIGNNPNLRPWDVRVTRILACDIGYGGGSQWYPEKATIPRTDLNAPETAFYDMAEIFYNISFFDPGYPVIGEFHPVTLVIGPFPQTRLIVAGESGTLADDRYFIDGEIFGTEGFEFFPAGTVFKVLFPGETCTIRVQNGANFNCGATGSIVAPVVSSLLPDMNPAHILREILISPDSGGTGIDAEAGDTWEAAADTLFTEGFGISIAWRGSTDRVDFKKEIERHIDARSYIDRRTGLWEIKLIRDDYDEGELPVFDTSNVVSWSNINFPQPSSLLNQLVVTWTDPNKGEPTSLTISNPARIRMAGSQVFQEKVSYPGITRSDLAGRVAMRDLSARSAPLVTGEFVAKNFPTDLNVGSVIIVHNPRLGLINKIVRVTEIDDGNIQDSPTAVKFIEDRFALDNESTLEIEIPAAEESFPQPVAPRMIEEAPLELLREQLGAANVDAVFAVDPEAGFLFIAGGRPTQSSLDATMLRDLGSGYEDLGALGFSASAATLGPFSNRADHTKIVVETTSVLASVAPGAKAWIAGEHCEVVLVEEGDTSGPGDYWAPTEASALAVFTLTLKRAVMDTAPAEHPVGSQILFYDAQGYLEDDIQTDGDSAAVRLQTNTTQGPLAFGLAPTDTVNFSSRALRPYPPADLRLDGDYQTNPPAADNDYVLTWQHRDRTVPGILGHDEPGPISPEVGTTYVVKIEALDGDGGVISVLTETNVGSALTYTWSEIPAPLGTVTGRITVGAIRGGLQSWQSPFIKVRLSIGERAFEDTDEDRLLEDGENQIRIIEG